MQVSTSLFYDRARGSMSGLSGRADTLQNQIASGKRLQAPSDDAVAYARLRTIAQQGADAGTETANLELAASLLAQGDTALGAIHAEIQRASELAVQARSGTNDATALGAIADELDQIRDRLVALGNTTDLRGQPLFGGADGGPAVIANADGSFSFADTPPSPIPAGAGGAIRPGEVAARIFRSDTGDVLATLDQLSQGLRAGTAVDATAAGAIDRLGAAAAQVLTVQASLGARAARVELEQGTLKQAGLDREAGRSALEDTDITAAITELQKTMTILSATQASFTKLQSLSLFNYLK